MKGDAALRAHPRRHDHGGRREEQRSCAASSSAPTIISPSRSTPRSCARASDSSLAKKRLHDRRAASRAEPRARARDRTRDPARLPAGGIPAPAGWELRAHFRPARQVAGDFYDAFALAGGRVAIVLADVCGKGVGAALFMALFRSLFRALAEPQFAAASDASEGLRATVQGTNDYIARTHGRANMFATVFFAVLDPASGRARVRECGTRAAGDPRRRRRGARATRADRSCRRAHARAAVRCGARVLGRGETLVAYTDGVVDARNPARGVIR